MVYRSSKVEMRDNSGVSLGVALGPGRAYRGQAARLGDKIKVAVKQSKNPNLTRGMLASAMLVQTKKPVFRPGGSGRQFGSTVGIVWNSAKDSPLGSRILCPVPLELRKVDGGSKVVSMATLVV